ncbi:MAG: hypothetical protein K1X53_07015, partial [Candidatus Sumerlaeaceae bacterium]|nr:hypothetical protein [Candidatus Sumerlaeaceae bacterium]
MPDLPPQREIPPFAFGADVPGIIHFQSGEYHSGRPRYSVFTFDCETACEWPAGTPPHNALERLDAAVKSMNPAAPEFCGLAGYISYDAAPVFEPACAVISNTNTPLLRLVRIDICHVYDRLTNSASVQFAPDCPPERRDHFLETLKTAAVPDNAPTRISSLTIDALAELNRDEYQSRVAQIQDHIRAGHFYEC